MNGSVDVDLLLAAVESGDGSAFVGLADALEEAGHPHAEEMSALAVEIVTTSDRSIAVLAAVVFFTLMEQVQ